MQRRKLVKFLLTLTTGGATIRRPNLHPTLLLLNFDVWMTQLNILPSALSRHPPQASLGVA